MKTRTFIFWIYLLVLFPHGLFSKSLTNKEQYNNNGENINDNSDMEAGNEDVALRENFRSRHKYKFNGRQTRFARSDNDNIKDQEAKAPQCAVMYKENEPVGILQPFKESYRFLPVSGDPTFVDINPIPVKRKTIMDVLYPNKINEDYINEETAENSANFVDERYPSIFAKFKIDSRLEKNGNPEFFLKRSMYKRDTEKPEITDQKVSSLKTTLSKIKEDNSAIVEEELKNILDDMGLIDDYDDKSEAKREVAEDEDMEQGTNKINLIKEEHNETRNKRKDESTTTEQSSNNNSPSLAIPTQVAFKEERTDEAEQIDLFQDGEAKINEEKKDLDKRDATDTLPSLNFSDSTLVKEAELNQYEKRVEREIRDKIQKLKEEVKEEIKNMKVDQKAENEEVDTRRRKRQVVNSLMDEETQNIDPNLNDQQGNEEHHVRRKRRANYNNDINNTVTLSHLNDATALESNGMTLQPSKIVNLVERDDLFLGGRADGPRFIVNFGEIDPEFKELLNSSLVNDRRVSDQVKTFDDSTRIISKRNNTNNTLMTSTIHKEMNNESKISGNPKPEARNPLDLKENINEEVNINSMLEISNNMSHYVNCKDNTCSFCRELYKNDNEVPTKISQDLAPNPFESSSKNTTDILKTHDVKRKKNIINILNVIGKKNQHAKKNCTNCQAALKQCNKRTKLKDRHNVTLTGFDNEQSPKSGEHGTNRSSIKIDKVFPNGKNFISLSTINSTFTRNEQHNKRILKASQSNNTKEVYDGDTVRRKRFIGINPILENATNSKNHYSSRNLKQFDEGTTKTKLENGIHVRVKRSDEGTEADKNIPEGKEQVREERQSKDDLEANAYQYEDDQEFNENQGGENEEYDDQPFVSDTGNADNLEGSIFTTNNAKSNCNCDKNGENCKCGAEKVDLSVPSIKEDFSNYVANPKRAVEKKSISHCNCDKNGKHCKCQHFDDGIHDYAEEEASVAEKKSAVLDDDAILNEFQAGAGARAPRQPRQRRKHAGKKSNMEESVGDNYESYETRSGKLTKREADMRKLAGNQQFENGEYFVDLHPDIYRLTPVDSAREKRDSFKDLVAIHGGGPALNHLVAVRQRSMLPHSRIRRRVQSDDNREPRQLIDMSDEDLFGALPQSFAGELARYKRVKRGKTEK